LSISRALEDAPTYAVAAATTEAGARLGMTTRETVHQIRIAREGGEVDERFAARQRLSQRQGRRASSSAQPASGRSRRTDGEGGRASTASGDEAPAHSSAWAAEGGKGRFFVEDGEIDAALGRDVPKGGSSRSSARRRSRAEAKQPTARRRTRPSPKDE
ncbi:MAG: hypothetical protein IJ131_11825, partial [Eggerthellaceae bacterium]|nr:hypothetical protein [Eggerthellaceae bacterium]